MSEVLVLETLVRGARGAEREGAGVDAFESSCIEAGVNCLSDYLNLTSTGKLERFAKTHYLDRRKVGNQHLCLSCIC